MPDGEDRTSIVLRAADAVAQGLAAAGCRFAFGVPGGETLVLIDALERCGIRYVSTKHEAAAGFMAEGVWHATGAPGVLVATIGPGVTNAVNVIANAALDRVPLIVLAGCVDPDDRLGYTHQVLDQARLLEPCVKASFTLSAANAATVTRRALALARAPRPGPVHIDVPIKVAGAPSVASRLSSGPLRAPVVPEPDAPAWEAARQSLAAAEWPLIIAGNDAVEAGAGAALERVAVRLRAPVIQTYKAKGLLPEDHDWALAAAALSPVADCQLLPLVKAADAILLVGYDAVEMRAGWQDPWDPMEKLVVDIAVQPNDQGMYAATVEAVGDPAAVLNELADLDGRSRWTEQAVADCAAAVRSAYRPDEAWGPAAIVDTVRRVFPRNGVATVDSGAHRILLSQIWQAYRPRTLLQSNGLCTMACALPLAMGAKIADPDRSVLAFVGDGGLLMGLGELATCAEQGLSFPIVVFVDRSLALIEKKQRESQLPAAGVALGATDFPACATALGGYGVTATTRADLENALVDALVADRFTLIACPFDARDYDGRI